jgi:hypothetical protein
MLLRRGRGCEIPPCERGATAEIDGGAAVEGSRSPRAPAPAPPRAVSAERRLQAALGAGMSGGLEHSLPARAHLYSSRPNADYRPHSVPAFGAAPSGGLECRPSGSLAHASTPDPCQCLQRCTAACRLAALPAATRGPATRGPHTPARSPHSFRAGRLVRTWVDPPGGGGRGGNSSGGVSTRARGGRRRRPSIPTGRRLQCSSTTRSCAKSPAAAAAAASAGWMAMRTGRRSTETRGAILMGATPWMRAARWQGADD